MKASELQGALFDFDLSPLSHSLPLPDSAAETLPQAVSVSVPALPEPHTAAWAMDACETEKRRYWEKNHCAAQVRHNAFPLKKIQRDLEPEWNGKPRLFHGWLMDLLIDADGLFVGRWHYWAKLMLERKLTPEQGPIPALEWESQGHGQTRKMLEQCLNAVTNYGGWEGWSSSTNFEYFVDWLLFGLGSETVAELPKEPMGCEGAGLRLYQALQLVPLLLWPYDYLGMLMSEAGFNKSLGFYPTPLDICKIMLPMSMGDVMTGGDNRALSVCDPCVGTGRMLLLAGDHCLRLYGMDVSHLACKVSLINAALYVPWLYRPLPWLEEAQEPQNQVACGIWRGNSLSDPTDGVRML